MLISLIIPLYNEEKRLTHYFPKLYIFMSKNFDERTFEIILIDDGSVDNTKQIANQLDQIYTDIALKIVSYHRNQGKGYAIQAGVLIAKGDYIFFSDIDLSTDLAFIKKALALLQFKNFDIVIPSRRLKQSSLVKKQSYLREYMGKTYTYLANRILNLEFTDITCGLKGFKRESAKKIFRFLSSRTWSFDAEILYKAKQLNYKIAEIPTVWKNDQNSKVNLFSDSLKSFIDLIKIRLTNV